jgi:hypothetical protein
MLNTGIQPWLFEAEPYRGESISHFLGRFRRQNYITSGKVGRLAGIGAVIARWEKFYLNPFPTPKELEALATVVGVSVERLAQMLPIKDEGIKAAPIRLCGACYAEAPCHRIEWQYKSVWKCDHHQLLLLCKCPSCEASFKIPALWEEGRCHRCLMPFSQMAHYQKAAQA